MKLVIIFNLISHCATAVLCIYTYVSVCVCVCVCYICIVFFCIRLCSACVHVLSHSQQRECHENEQEKAYDLKAQVLKVSCEIYQYIWPHTLILTKVVMQTLRAQYGWG